jgi:hypothetical protein
LGISTVFVSAASSGGEEVEIVGGDETGFGLVEVDEEEGGEVGVEEKDEAEDEDFFFRFFLSLTDFEAEGDMDEFEVDPREFEEVKRLKVGTVLDDDGDALASPPLRIKRAQLLWRYVCKPRLALA